MLVKVLSALPSLKPDVRKIVPEESNGQLEAREPGRRLLSILQAALEAFPASSTGRASFYSSPRTFEICF
jgi:hypothetical protein